MPAGGGGGGPVDVVDAAGDSGPLQSRPPLVVRSPAAHARLGQRRRHRRRHRRRRRLYVRSGVEFPTLAHGISSGAAESPTRHTLSSGAANLAAFLVLPLASAAVIEVSSAECLKDGTRHARVPGLGLEDVDIHQKITRLQLRSILFHLSLFCPSADGIYSFKNENR